MNSDEHQPYNQRRTFRWFTIILVAAVVMGTPIAWAVLSFTTEPRAAGREFVDALREGDFDKAFTMCSDELQQHLGDAAELARRTKQSALPESWWWTSSRRQGNEARLSSSAKTWWSRFGLSVTLVRQGDEWRVVRMASGIGGVRMELAPR